jgi:predicted nucleic acid-binding protein
VIIDTDVLIWYLRGNEKAQRAVEANRNFSLSAVSYMELVQGMADKRELALFRRTMRAWNATIIYIDREISSKAMLYVEAHCLSHSMQLADALIAATAVQCGQPLLTGNARHYRIIKELDLKPFRV